MFNIVFFFRYLNNFWQVQFIIISPIHSEILLVKNEEQLRVSLKSMY